MGEIRVISSRYVDELAALDPVRGVRMLGPVGDWSRLTDYSPGGQAAIAELYRRTTDALRAVEPEDEAERLGRLYLLATLDADRAMIEAGERNRLVSILAGPPASLHVSFDLLPRESADDWSMIATRLEGMADALAGYRASLQAGLDSGAVAARRSAEAVAQQCATWASGSFSTYVAEYGDGPLRSRLDAAAAAAGAAYGDLGSWLRTTYLPASTDEVGVGDDRYRLWGRYMLGTELDLDATYAWGWEELARLEAEQVRECDRIIPGAGFEEVRELLDTDPDRCLHDVESFRAWLQEITDEAIEKLDGWQFDIPAPLKRCEIGIPPEGGAAAPYYTAPSEDLSRPGRTWFPIAGRTRFPKWNEVTTAYHEAVPGHHLQCGVTRMLDLTRAHKLGFQSAHGEGWALYAERLMDELGQFTTPDTRLGFLSSQAFRAARVVIDIGLHTGRPLPDGSTWTYDVAVDRLQRAGVSRSFAESEVLRYISWPTQATTYKLGERAWLAGRHAAITTQGDSFDLKAWHAAALELGALGLADLERELATAGSAPAG